MWVELRLGLGSRDRLDLRLEGKKQSRLINIEKKKKASLCLLELCQIVMNNEWHNQDAHTVFIT